MTEAPTPTRARLSIQESLAIGGSAIVFLLATAGLLNMWLSHAPLPEALRIGAVVAHLSTVLLALPLGIAQVLLPKGTFRHRTVGYIGVGLMVFTALVSFTIHTINPHGLSPIHIFSVMTLVAAPVIVLSARAHNVERHRGAVFGLILGGLAIAGLFTFLPGRALGQLVMRLFSHG